MVLPLATVAALAISAPATAATVTGVAVGADSITLTFDEAVTGASAALIAGPDRIAVDVVGLEPGAALTAGGVVRRVRERPGPDATRVELELARPETVVDGRFGEGGRSLTLSLRPVAHAEFAAASRAAPLDFFPFSFGNRAAPASKVKARITIPPRAEQIALPPVRGDRSRPLVVIDAGHGGFDPGAIASDTGLREKDVTLKIAKAIRDDLLKSGRVRVALTRDDDRYLVLRERFGIARRLHADLFISIHCDSVGAGEASGASVYTLSEVASDKEAARLAARENKADVISGVDLGAQNADVSSILIDLTQRETMNNSAEFARLLGREAESLVPEKANFHRMASLMVLKAPDMPSILFETGYISNPRDAQFLNSDDGRGRIAEAIRKAVEIHFARRLASR